RPSSERATSVAPAKRSSALSTVAPCRTKKTRVTVAFIVVTRHRANFAKRQRFARVLAFGLRRGRRESEEEDRNETRGNRRRNRQHVHDPNQRVVIRGARESESYEREKNEQCRAFADEESAHSDFVTPLG